MAAVMSFEKFMLFRGRRRFGLSRPRSAERCRVRFHLETDRGPFVIKNLDDPVTGWKPLPPLPAEVPRAECGWRRVEWVADGTGSGMHLDDEPEELFPLPIFAMASEHAHDAPGVVEFLRSYGQFYAGANLLVCDRQLRSGANRRPSGRNTCGSMVCRTTAWRARFETSAMRANGCWCRESGNWARDRA